MRYPRTSSGRFTSKHYHPPGILQDAKSTPGRPPEPKMPALYHSGEFPRTSFKFLPRKLCGSLKVMISVELDKHDAHLINLNIHP